MYYVQFNIAQEQKIYEIARAIADIVYFTSKQNIYIPIM